MIVLVVAALGLLGGTTWLALDQPLARDPARHHRVTGWGLLMCLGVGAAVVGAAFAHAA